MAAESGTAHWMSQQRVRSVSWATWHKALVIYLWRFAAPILPRPWMTCCCVSLSLSIQISTQPHTNKMLLLHCYAPSQDKSRPTNPMPVHLVGARGLMQLMPATAKLVTKRARLPASYAGQLNDPKINIQLGSYHLAWLIERFNGQRPSPLRHITPVSTE